MKTTLAYKVAGTLAAVLAAATLSAAAQDTSAPATAPADAGQMAPATTPPATLNPGTATPQTTVTGQEAAAGSAAKDFIQQAFLNNEFGIAAGQVALQQASSPSAKAAAQQVLDDGLKTRTAMITAIQGSTSDMHFSQDWTDDYKQKLAELQSTAGAAFDTKYLATQSEVTKQSQGLFSNYAQIGTDASVKTFAANTLPVLQADSAKLDAAVAAAPSGDATATTTTKTTKKSKANKGTR